jgi:hypothetical protein
MEALFVKENFNIRWVAQTGFVENINSILKEYKQSRGLLVTTFAYGFLALGVKSVELTAGVSVPAGRRVSTLGRLSTGFTFALFLRSYNWHVYRIKTCKPNVRTMKSEH